MSEIQLRQARLDDLPTLLSFEQGIVAAERPFAFNLKEGEISYYDLKELILSDEVEVLVIEHDGKVVASGYAKIRQAKPYQRYARQSYLGFMYVVPECRGKGLNQMMIEALADWSRAQGLKEMALDVYAENAAAIRAYEKAGFEKNILEMCVEL